MTRLKLVTVEDCPVPERVHVVDNRATERPAGIDLSDILVSILTAPFATDRLRDEMLSDSPRHQPECFDAPIPGRQWYGGCNPDGGRIHPVTGRCTECGESACRECGRENCPDGCEALEDGAA